jgi:hypothetical protein
LPFDVSAHAGVDPAAPHLTRGEGDDPGRHGQPVTVKLLVNVTVCDPAPVFRMTSIAPPGTVSELVVPVRGATTVNADEATFVPLHTRS